MRKGDVLVVGGSAAGIEAAITIRKHHKADKTIVIRKEQRALVPCGIPYIVSTLGSVEKDIVPDTLLEDAELVIDEVTSIDRGAQSVTTA